MKTISFLGLILLCSTLLGQTPLFDGKQVKDVKLKKSAYSAQLYSQNGDTLFGTLNLRQGESIVSLQGQIHFTTSDGISYIVKPGRVKGFALFLNSDTIVFESMHNDFYAEIVYGFFNPVVIRSDSFFLQKINQGYCSLYYIRQARVQGTHLSVTVTPTGFEHRTRSDDGGPAEVEDGISAQSSNYFCIRCDGGRIKVVDPMNIADSFADCPDLRLKSANGYYTYDDLPEIVKVYNQFKENMKFIPVKY